MAGFLQGMAAPTLAWGEPHLFSMPDGSHLYGREFDLLPAGTMFAANVILHGLVGVEATVGSDDVARVESNATLEVYGTRGTSPHELAAYETAVIEIYRIHLAQQAQG